MVQQHHAAGFFQDDRMLLERVSAFAGEGLQHKDTVIVVATASHQTALRKALFSLPDLDQYVDHYLCFDAADSLAQFMEKGWPDEEGFKQFFGGLLYHLTSRGSRVRIYGEMAALLRTEGQRGAALHLEELWDRLATTVEFSLLCGYPMAGFQGAHDPELHHISGLHSNS
jgi:hypothetical protein